MAITTLTFNSGRLDPSVVTEAAAVAITATTGKTGTIVIPADHSKLFVSVPVTATIANFAVKTVAPGGTALLTEDYDLDGTSYPRANYKGGDNLKFFIGAGCSVVISGTISTTLRVWSAR